MSDEIMRELAQLGQYASELQNLVNSAQSKAPQRCGGQDRTQTIEVILGPDGLPELVSVASDWQAYLSSQQISTAVGEAYESAVKERTIRWAGSLERSGWAANLEGPRDHGTAPPADPLWALPATYRRHVEEAAPRALDNLTEEVIGLLDNVDQFVRRPDLTATGTGWNSLQTIVLTLSPAALQSCTVDSQWAADQDGASLTNAFDEALRAARSALSQAVEAPNPAAGLDRLLGEILSVLHHPHRLTES
ncbi:hypothetical protein WEI85_43180 [Actinomycetes bacterium KLBMP 9797]